MKKGMLLAFVSALLCGPVFAAAQSVNGGAVTLNAIIPSYIGFIGQNVQTVTFDYTNLGLNVATGLPITKLASAVPTWTLMYNLSGSKNINLCAYSTPLAGSGTYSIPTSSLYAAPIGSTTAAQFNQTISGCGTSGQAFALPAITNATSSTGKTVGFSGMFLQTPDGTVVPPDTYTGTLSIVAQVQ